MPENATSKPRWVECADKAFEVLEKAREVREPEEKNSVINEGFAWMRLAEIYQIWHLREHCSSNSEEVID